MTYDTVATMSQVTSLLLFIGMSIAVSVYVFLPRNRQRLETAARKALDLDAPNKTGRGQV